MEALPVGAVVPGDVDAKLCAGVKEIGTVWIFADYARWFVGGDAVFAVG